VLLLPVALVLLNAQMGLGIDEINSGFKCSVVVIGCIGFCNLPVFQGNIAHQLECFAYVNAVLFDYLKGNVTLGPVLGKCVQSVISASDMGIGLLNDSPVASSMMFWPFLRLKKDRGSMNNGKPNRQPLKTRKEQPLTGLLSLFIGASSFLALWASIRAVSPSR